MNSRLKNRPKRTLVPIFDTFSLVDFSDGNSTWSSGENLNICSLQGHFYQNVFEAKQAVIHQTFTKRADMIVDLRLFAKNFTVLVFVYHSDEQCSSNKTHSRKKLSPNFFHCCITGNDDDRIKKNKKFDIHFAIANRFAYFLPTTITVIFYCAIIVAYFVPNLVKILARLR